MDQTTLIIVIAAVVVFVIIGVIVVGVLVVNKHAKEQSVTAAPPLLTSEQSVTATTPLLTSEQSVTAATPLLKPSVEIDKPIFGGPLPGLKTSEVDVPRLPSNDHLGKLPEPVYADAPPLDDVNYADAPALEDTDAQPSIIYSKLPGDIKADNYGIKNNNVTKQLAEAVA